MSQEIRQFAILKHQWNGVHWDFLVEDGPTLRTWAIDSPIVPDKDLPARELPAHRRIYLDYEGEISGGRGSVTRWDRGECDPIEWGADRVRLLVRGAQIVGEVELRRDVDLRIWWFRLGKLS
ncbi:DNA polymerase ligase N-terminal domain-containing protein [Tundrisphaera lichenicola]|uniref:DNA polymerase ligase N-terminal domain-containing protein n=1 Tax=Tundrisphaera lichenicola TaxID=2029860 RepID=UPI003EB81810